MEYLWVRVGFFCTVVGFCCCSPFLFLHSIIDALLGVTIRCTHPSGAPTPPCKPGAGTWTPLLKQVNAAFVGVVSLFINVKLGKFRSLIFRIDYTNLNTGTNLLFVQSTI